MDNLTLKDKIEYAWKHFEYHAKQRMTTFRFYIIFSGFLFGGVATILSSENYLNNKELLNFIIACILLIEIIISFLFWLLDRRAKYLVNISKEILNKFETKNNSEDVPLLFSTDKTKDKPIDNPCFTYEKIFEIIFLIFSIISLLFIFILYFKCYCR